MMTADESTATVQTLMKKALELSSRIFDRKKTTNLFISCFGWEMQIFRCLLTFAPFLNVVIAHSEFRAELFSIGH